MQKHFTNEDIFKEISISNHNSFLIKSNNREFVYNYLKEKLGKNKENFFLYLQIFDIEKAREIINYSRIEFSQQIFIVISFFSINIEAQNALLKLIEDANNIKIIIISNFGVDLLQTFNSRLYKLEIIYEDNIEEKQIEELVLKFIKTKKIERMDIKGIKEILTKKDIFALQNDNKDRLDKEYAELFLLKLHNYLFSLIENNQIEISNKYLELLDDTKESLKYIKNNSSNMTIIFEYLSLKIPENM